MKVSFLPWLGASVLSLNAVAPFSEYVSDDAALFFEVRDISNLLESLEDHPVAEWLESEEMSEVFSGLSEFDSGDSENLNFEQVLKEEFDLTTEELLELFPGQLAFVLYGGEDVASSAMNNGAGEMVILAEYDGTSEQLDELMQIQFERNAKAQKEVNSVIEHEMIKETFMGETLFFDERFDGEEEVIEDGYALVDGVFILATPEERLRTTVEAIKEGPENRFSTTPVYSRAQSSNVERDVAVYVNFPAFLPELGDILVGKLMDGGLGASGMLEQGLRNALAFDSLEGLFTQFEIGEEGLKLFGGLTYSEKSGWLKLLAYDEGELPNARYVPDGVLASSVTSFDLSLFVAELENLFGQMSPMMRGLMDGQLQAMKIQTGIDFRASILENFGNELVTISALPAEQSDDSVASSEPQQLYIISINDAETLSSAIESIKDLIPGSRDMLKTREHAGETIHTFVAPQPDAGTPTVTFGYVLTRSRLLINSGGLGLLQEVLTRMESGDDGFWQDASIVEFFDRMESDGVVGRSYMDLGQLSGMMVDAIEEAGLSELGVMDMDALQSAGEVASQFRFVSQNTLDAEGFYFYGLLVESEASE